MCCRYYFAKDSSEYIRSIAGHIDPEVIYYCWDESKEESFMSIIFVGIGGAIGAILRYLISMIPVKSDFPILTLVTNVIGAFAIGCIVALAKKYDMPKNVVLMLKTGVCGGFTTFSTFSLEAYNLLESRKIGIGITYAGLSLVLCVVAVLLGEAAVSRLS